jgi:hypothetical protein
MYASVLLFTSGIGILIYKNIDSIGHVAIYWLYYFWLPFFVFTSVLKRLWV